LARRRNLDGREIKAASHSEAWCKPLQHVRVHDVTVTITFDGRGFIVTERRGGFTVDGFEGARCFAQAEELAAFHIAMARRRTRRSVPKQVACSV
jgi:hypothetical protein